MGKTFGKTSNGASSSANSGDQIHASKFTLSENGYVTKLTARTWVESTAQPAKGIVYEDSAGSPGAFKCISPEVTISATTEGEVDFALASPTYFVAADYWLCEFFNGAVSPGQVYISRDNTASQRLVKVATYPTYPDPFGTPDATLGGPLDIYATYTPLVTVGGAISPTGAGSFGHIFLSAVTGALSFAGAISAARLIKAALTAAISPARNWVQNVSFENWSGGLPVGWTTDNGALITQESTNKRTGSYSMRIEGAGAYRSGNFSVSADLLAYLKGKQVTFACWAKTNRPPNSARLDINDGVGNTLGTSHTGGGGWELLKTTHTVSGSATQVVAKCVSGAAVGAGQYVYFDDPFLVAGSSAVTMLLHKILGRPSGAISPTGALTGLIHAIYAGTLTSAGALSKVVKQSFAGTLTSAGALTSAIHRQVAIAGTLTMSGAMGIVKKAWAGLRRMRVMITDTAGNIKGHLLP